MKSTTKQTLLLLSGIKATQLAEQINAIKVTDDKNTYDGLILFKSSYGLKRTILLASSLYPSKYYSS